MNAYRGHLLSAVGLGCLLAAVGIVLQTPDPTQYEISIYEGYPGHFWLLLVGAFVLGGLTIVASAAVPEDRTWVFGTALLLLTNALFLLLPLVRGYMLYGHADPMSHIGYVRDIVSSGSVGDNIYPPMHLLVMAVSEATGADLFTIGLAVPLVFAAVYFVGMYYVLVYLFDSRRRVLFGLPFVLLPILGDAHVSLRPYDLSLLFLPVVFYLFFKSQRSPTPSTRIAFVVALVTLLLYHPLTALFLVGIFSLYFVARIVPGIDDRYSTPTNFISLSAVIFLAWYSNFTGIITRFNSAYYTLFGPETGEAPVDTYAATAEEASPPLIDILREAIALYGVAFSVFTLGFLFLAVGSILFVRRRYSPTSYTVMLGATLAVFSFGGLCFLLVDLIVPPSRPFQIAKIGAVVLAGQLFYLLADRVSWPTVGSRTGVRLFFLVAIVVLAGLSVVTFYPSPYGTADNPQVTEMELSGSEWITTHGNTDNQLGGIELSHRRFHHAQNGVDAPLPFSRAVIPARFNYTERPSLGASYSEDAYLTVTRRGRILYPELFPGYRDDWRYTPSDFARLERDRTVDRIYDNGDYNQYRIRGTATAENGN
ncbi:hypothetical protein GRX03_15420 [Halovenus sp. WSH3]|uniref:Glycosyltransferase RgtA/B/C/D-like domain-containing protein n=1 Tax=Halovenus carboxidivorans TaxID=2692199 RepID=A0A6B0T3X7_9EURY|nr:hypothetical protein [Halovenus carboxidivorans]MXR52988.1 hypothetical protein [Halovenus carboxidivorans]